MTSAAQRWLYRSGDLAEGPWESVVDDRIDGWRHTGLRVAHLDEERTLSLERAGEERMLIPLAGSFTVEWREGDGAVITLLAGRASEFDGPTDVLYLSSAASATITGSGRIAIASSPTDTVLPSRYLPSDGVPVELRGAGASSREVHNFGVPGVLDAARLIVCEVITPSGNWSSYPPHKHDEHVTGQESRLEEIYYFAAAPESGAPAGVPDGVAAAPFGLFHTYSSPAGEIEVDAVVRSGDIALVPFGYHGPAVAAPGYDLYYLNVMAGPDADRAWLITDDPVHAWVRDTWIEQDVDPRLPFGHDRRKRS
jgi:5-deoxy-glucuronate isomerase